MQPINKTTLPNLVSQIDSLKNYYEHRRRVQSTLQRPLLNKSISYDKQKLMLHQYIKNRKQYTIQYSRKEFYRLNSLRDSKMLRNILDYDSKIFSFSLNKLPKTHSTLHHNALVSTNRKNECIHTQNHKLHLRISKAKSLYTNLFPYKSIVSSACQFSVLKTNQPEQGQNLPSLTLNTEIQIKNPQLKIEQDFTRSQHFKSDDLQLSQFKNRRSSSAKNQNKLDLLMSQLSKKKIKICQRTRRLKMAEMLFEKKQKFQKGILSKLKTNS